MGDIAEICETTVTLHVDLATDAPLERLEIWDGLDLIETVRPYEESSLGQRIRISCRGQEYRGRGRLVNWQGKARFTPG